jgi:signal transduction histidine kinase
MNVRRHAGTDHVRIRVHEHGAGVLLEVSDDGRGFQGPEGLGLFVARQRLEDVGGGLEVRVRPGGGTLLTAWVPARGAGA